MLNLPADVSFEPRAAYRPVKSGTYVCHRSARKSERSSNRRYEVAPIARIVPERSAPDRAPCPVPRPVPIIFFNISKPPVPISAAATPLVCASLPAIIRLNRLWQSPGNFRFALPSRVTSTDDAGAIDDDCGHRATTIHRVPPRRAVENIRLVSPNLMTTEGQGCAKTGHDLEL